MSEERAIDHVVGRCEPQILDYVEKQGSGGKTEIMRDTPIIADHKENLIGSTKVSQIIADSRVDAKMDNRINHSTNKAVDKVGREIVHFEVKMNEVEI
ncbi:hypothetical protein TNCV_2052531 [Trichonephila clavipes]|nr:hypothetical protein TNCV_2052531 [Trichonephila clavipes]